MDPVLAAGTVVIIGAASGIGRATAVAFAVEGCKNIALGDVNTNGLEETCSMIQKLWPDIVVEGYQVDVADETSVEDFHRKVQSKFNRIDSAVNSAGYGHPPTSIDKLIEKEWNLSYSVNQKGTFLCERAQLRQMLQQEPISGSKCRGSIVNVTSLCQTAPMNNYAAYSASKGGVLGLTRCDAFDYGPDGIRVNCVAPGNTTTAMLTEAVGEAGLKALAAATPLRRNASPKDIANAIVWLSGSKASFVTGTTLTVDGGFNLSTSSM